MKSYPYSKGELIEQPNTYFYSEYYGLEFVSAWRRERLTVLATLPEAVPPPAPRQGDLKSRQSIDLLERALASDSVLREAFVKKFEIHKRVHDGYDESFRSLDREARHSYPLYLRAADLFAAAYEESESLRHLNVYLKCLDTLCAEVRSLPRDLAARLAWHLKEEQIFIEMLIAARRINA